MSVQTDLDAAKAKQAADAIADQADVDAAQAACDAAQPHITWVSELEQEAEKLEGEVAATWAALIAKGKALLNI